MERKTNGAEGMQEEGNCICNSKEQKHLPRIKCTNISFALYQFYNSSFTFLGKKGKYTTERHNILRLSSQIWETRTWWLMAVLRQV